MTEQTTKPEKFYFMGICGTAMGAIASALKSVGHDVVGSDLNVYPPMSTFLESRGIEILQGFDAENIPDDVDLVVVGNAMSRGNAEVESTLNKRFLYASLPEVMKRYFLQGMRNFVVTGTHGKTTTTSLLTWIMESAGLKPNYMIGGIPDNFGSGSRFGTGSRYVVLEGDEYDTAFFDKRSKFVHYLPEVVIVNNIEFDHADIFDDVEQIKQSFRRMLNVVPQNGMVIINGDDPNCQDVGSTCPAPVLSVGLGDHCDRQITDIRYEQDGSHFLLDGAAFHVPMDGEFNVRNAAMALTAALHGGITAEAAQKGLTGFQGIARRQQLRGETARGIKVIDDFGHHPTAMRQALEAMRRRYDGHRLWALFEPRSNSTRRNVFQNQLPEALSGADRVCISAIPNPEKVPEDERLDPELIVEALSVNGRMAWHEPDSEAIVHRLEEEAEDGDVVIVFSNGGFGGIHDRLLEVL